MAFEAYLYIDGVNGDSTSKIANDKSPNKLSPIEIKTYGLGIEMPLVENRSATGALTVGRANFDDFETEKSLDKSTASLLFFCLSGKHIPKAYVHVYRSTGEDESEGKSTLYMEILYDDVIITEVGLSASGDEMPSETLKFTYGKVIYRYHKTDTKTGKSINKKAEFTWDRVSNSGKKDVQ